MSCCQTVCCLQDIPSPTVIGGNGQIEPLIIFGTPFSAPNKLLKTCIETGQVTNNSETNAIAVKLLDPSLKASPHHFTDQLHPFDVPCHTWQESLLRPTPVAIHNDSNVTGHGR